MTEPYRPLHLLGMSDERLREIETLITEAEQALEGTTPGPWVREYVTSEGVHHIVGCGNTYIAQPEVARFAVTTRNLLPRLIEALKRIVP